MTGKGPEQTNSAATANNAQDDTNYSSWNNPDQNPMVWWMNHIAWKNPANVLLLSSIPFCAGAYIGFKKPTEKLQELVGTAGDGISKDGGGGGVPPAEYRRLGLRMAARALKLATLGTFGTFGVLGAVGFYASGYRSMDECIDGTTKWATRWRQSFENWMGLEDRPSQTHPEVLATKHMNEDEVLNYIYDKYVKEPEDTQENSSSPQSENSSEK